MCYVYMHIHKTYRVYLVLEGEICKIHFRESGKAIKRNKLIKYIRHS